MKLVPSTEKDIETLTRWIEADPYHKDCLDPYWWLTGNGLLCFCLRDTTGPLCYVRIDKKDQNGLMALHTQFAPEEEVSNLRLIKGMLWCVPIVQKFCKQWGGSGLVFQSVSPILIDFMKRKFSFEELDKENFVWRIKQEG